MFLYGKQVLASIIALVIFTMAVLVTFWQVFERKRATSYLFAGGVRMFFLSLVFVLVQTDVNLPNFKKDGHVWVVLAMLMMSIGLLVHPARIKRNFSRHLAGWEEMGKTNIKKGYFSLAKTFQTSSPDDPKWDKMKSLVVVIPVGVIVLRLVFDTVGINFRTIFIHLLVLGLGYAFFYFCIQFFVWLKEFKRLEKDLGITFITEYGWEEQKEKRKRR